MPGPGYPTPLDAAKFGPREKRLFVTCARYDSDQPDMLATVDVDECSNTYGKILHKLHLNHARDEIHHSGWNACSSCYGDSKCSRTHMILPCLNTSRVYIADCSGEKPFFHKVIEPSELFKHDVSFGHTSHCLANGKVMISTLGDAQGNAKGSFLQLNGKTFEVEGTWGNVPVNYGYDYWYQPYHNVMISTAWGHPNLIKKGFNLDDVVNGKYGHELYVWNWKEGTLAQTLKLDPVKGSMPLEVRFMHNPRSVHGYVGCALGSTIYHLLYNEKTGKVEANCVIELPSKKVAGWVLPEMPALITDILVSLDDRFLYVSTWLHGDLLQYDITQPDKPILVGKVNIGGSIGGDVKLLSPTELAPPPCFVKGQKVEGGSQMLQLSLDGRRMYVTTSLYSVWDNQFYPNMIKNGASLVRVDIDTGKGGLSLNQDLHIKFNDSDGPIMAHEMRYDGGDCSSDIWLDPSTGGCCSSKL